MSDYPKKMVHPNYHKAKSVIAEARGSKVTAQGEPDRFPPVWVNNDDQEAYERSRGYRVEGDGMEHDPDIGFQRYPMWMEREKKHGEGHSATEERLVHSFDEEKRAKTQGFREKGKSNPSAYHQAVAAPLPPDHVVVEYPKWVGEVLVNSYEEEKALRKKTAPPPLPVVDPEAEARKEANRVAQSERMKSYWQRKKEQIAAALTPSPSSTGLEM